jgi:hypothetical protein
LDFEFLPAFQDPNKNQLLQSRHGACDEHGKIMKLQNPKFKIQKNFKPQTSSNGTAHAVWILNIEHFLKFDFWILNF